MERESDPQFTARVRALDPWWFAFELGGETFGGQVPRDTEKVDLFFEWAARFGRVETILELGSHEGSHSLQLAGRPGVRRVLGLEGQEDNLRRAQFLLDLYRPENLEFRHCNLEHFDPGQYGRFDAVFCAGLLYHLPEPWRLIEKLAGMCRFLYLDTHYAASEKCFVAPYAGSWFEEQSGALSGLSSRSFWLCFKDLLMLLMANGFLVRYVRDMEETKHGPRAWFFAEKVDQGQVGSRCSSEHVGPSPPLDPGRARPRRRRRLEHRGGPG